MKIVFFGTPRFAQIVLENLVGSEFKPSLVVTAPDAKVGRGQFLTPPPVKETAIGAKIKVLQPKILNNTSQFDLAILVAYGQLIPKKILEIPKFGFINVHPSLLPRYRGPSPIQAAILAGDKATGITIMKLDEKLDHGPILTQKEVEITSDDTHLTLVEKLGLVGSNLLLEVLPDYLQGKIKLKDQDHKKATITQKITKKDGLIENMQNPPDRKTLDRMIRAYYPWPTVWAELAPSNQKPATKIKLLPQGMVQVEGKRPMSVQEFTNGYPQYKNLFGTLDLNTS